MVKNIIFRKEGTKMVLNAPYMEAYIPYKYFPAYAKEFGRDFELYGIFPYRVFSNSDKSDGGDLKIYKLPVVFLTTPSAYEIKEVELMKNLVGKYYILQYYEKDVIMKSTEIIQSMSNLENLLNLLIHGNIINTIRYDDVIKLVIKAMHVNSCNLKTPLVTIEAIISEIYRYKKDPSYPVRFYIGKNFTEDAQYEYVANNLREVCGSNSVFSAVTFEDQDSALTLAIAKGRYGRRQAVSPVEELLDM